MSPKLFITTLEHAFISLEWENKSINIDREKLSHLRFTDDVVVISVDLKVASDMINELKDVARNIG